MFLHPLFLPLPHIVGAGVGRGVGRRVGRGVGRGVGERVGERADTFEAAQAVQGFRCTLPNQGFCE